MQRIPRPSSSQDLLSPSPLTSRRSSLDSTPDSCTGDQQVQDEGPASIWWQLFAFLCTILMGFGSRYSANVVSALKPAIKQNYAIDNAAYGVIQASVSLVNTVIPLAGGRYIDSFGTLNGSVLSSTLIMVGNLLFVQSAYSRSFTVLVISRVLYGLGSTTVILVQHTILAHWFRGSALALTIGIQIATSRLASFLAMAVSVPIKDRFGWFGYALWASFGLCFVSWVVNVVYVVLVRYVPTPANNKESDPLLPSARKRTGFSDMYQFPTEFWIIAGLSLVMGSAWTAFLHISPDLIMVKYHQDESVASLNASLGQFVPVLGSPVVGYLMDQYGHRPKWILVSAACFVACLSMIMAVNTIPAYVPFLLFSTSLAIGPVAMVSGIGMVIDSGSTATAFGIYKSMANVAITLLDPGLGWIQDWDNGSYDWPVLVLLGLGVLALALGAAVWVVDRRHLGLLNANKANRHSILLREEWHDPDRVAATSPEDPSVRSSPKNVWRVRILVAGMGALMVVGWVVWIALLVNGGI